MSFILVWMSSCSTSSSSFLALAAASAMAARTCSSSSSSRRFSTPAACKSASLSAVDMVAATSCCSRWLKRCSSACFWKVDTRTTPKGFLPARRCSRASCSRTSQSAISNSHEMSRNSSARSAMLTPSRTFSLTAARLSLTELCTARTPSLTRACLASSPRKLETMPVTLATSRCTLRCSSGIAAWKSCERFWIAVFFASTAICTPCSRSAISVWPLLSPSWMRWAETLSWLYASLPREELAPCSRGRRTREVGDRGWSMFSAERVWRCTRTLFLFMLFSMTKPSPVNVTDASGGV
mmetsp:Transcript_20124/g.77046  ORF Transcript_20124/g.77046 Transcript_20124/m.77046 type:complete len:296 (-) Transcript_20124:835-1722(-)